MVRMITTMAATNQRISKIRTRSITSTIKVAANDKHPPALPLCICSRLKPRPGDGCWPATGLTDRWRLRHEFRHLASSSARPESATTRWSSRRERLHRCSIINKIAGQASPSPTAPQPRFPAFEVDRTQVVTIDIITIIDDDTTYLSVKVSCDTFAVSL
jgi:hypothetical protein